MKKKLLWLAVFFLLFIPNVFAKSYYVMEDGNYMLCEDPAPGVEANCRIVSKGASGLSINTKDEVIVYEFQEYHYNEDLQEEYDKSLNGTSRMFYYMKDDRYVLCKTTNSCKTYTFERLGALGAIISNNNQIVLNNSEGPGVEEIYYYNSSYESTTNDQTPTTPSTNENSTPSTKEESVPTTNTCSKLKDPLKFIGRIVLVVKILIPIIIIALGIVDFFRAIIGSKDDEIKKSARSLLFRIISGVVIFFIPTIVSVVFSFIDDFAHIKGDFDACQKCIFRVNDCK